MHSRIFYDVPELTLSRVRCILVWAHKNALRTQIDQLDCKVSYARQRSDNSFEEVMHSINKSCVGYFRLVIDKSDYHIIDEFKGKPVLEVFIRGIEIQDVEYFIFIYLTPDKLEYLNKKYEIRQQS